MRARGLPKWLLWIGIGIDGALRHPRDLRAAGSRRTGSPSTRATGSRSPSWRRRRARTWFGTNVMQSPMCCRPGDLRLADRNRGGAARGVLLALCIGVPLGLLSGYVGGKLDRGSVLVMDALFAFPYLLLAIVIAFLLSDTPLGGGIITAAVAITVVYMPQYFRVVRNSVLSASARSPTSRPRARSAPGRRTIIDALHLRQRDPDRAGDRDAERRRRHPHPRRAGLPRLRHPADRGRRMGLRRPAGDLRRRRRDLVDGGCSRAARSSCWWSG